MKCKREAGFANPGPFNDVRNLSATDEDRGAVLACRRFQIQEMLT
jgi:hypothetical protein